ncbi:MAG: family 10 glycosylhydrolase, partial [Klebsiella sp.]|nr:family 10 glycosylhydrolase [Klebsiella sp.]
NTRPKTVTELNGTLSQVPASVYVLHPEWIRTSGDRFVLDPGIPEVRDWITSIVAEVVEHYPVDGVQFDDYFYTESPGSALNDSRTFQQYGQGFAAKADWRRHNTQLLIEQVSRTIKQLNPEVEFGVSPAGVWRNRSHDPAGSDTRGAAAYDESYADTRLWVQQGWLDYIAPQIYWPFARDAARYDVLAKWWADVVKPTHTRLYIGVALYKVGEPSKNEPDWMINGGVPELKKQLDLNESMPQIQGTILFRENYLNQPQTQQAVNYLKSRWGG